MSVMDASRTVPSAAKGSERKRWRTLQKRIERARDLRRAGNQAEQAMWELLCTRPLGGARFRRMQPIGPYLATFVCTTKKLVVEIDGEDDAVRTQFMQLLGWRVARFAPKDVLDDPEEAWQEIFSLLKAPSSPETGQMTSP
ncbi:MAG: endonuclease domain-containing protein [Rhodospirillales bacterium]|nr:endonuclease domain-containing protein [Rhodospirillales bacterium]